MNRNNWKQFIGDVGAIITKTNGVQYTGILEYFSYDKCGEYLIIVCDSGLGTCKFYLQDIARIE